MITCSFTGNLGNHMWQYAITREVAERNGYQWGFNPEPEFDYYHGTPQMNFMDIDYGISHDFRYSETPPGIKEKWEEKHFHSEYFSGDSVDYHPFQPDIFEIKDNTKLFIRCCQDAKYLDRRKTFKWFKIKEEKEEEYNRILYAKGIELNDDICVINVRGGEYRGVPNLLLGLDYWWRAINYMITDVNRKMRFIIITDDVVYAQSIIPANMEIPVYHFEIGCDYYVIHNAKNLILSNSSFAIFPAWLNQNNPHVIAPRYWARYNTSSGYWANSDVWTFGWLFLDKEDGKLHDR